jgi:tetratricopeptide (TPR) repeat protein
VDRASKAVAFAAGLFLVISLGHSARAASGDFEFARKLVDNRLHWDDLAERLLKRLCNSNNNSEKAEGLLGLAYLRKSQGDRQKDLEVRAKLYDGEDGAKSYLKKYKDIAGKDHRLHNDSLALEGEIGQQQVVLTNLRLKDPRTPEAVKKDLRVKLVAQQESALSSLKTALDEAEKNYKKALSKYRDPSTRAGNSEKEKDKAYGKYVEASQRYIIAYVRMADSLEKGSQLQKDIGLKISNFVIAWVQHQDKETYEDPPEGVQMWMSMMIGKGYVIAGDMAKAVKEGFDKVREIDPGQFPRGPAQKWAWQVFLTAALMEAEGWFETAEVSKNKEDYKKALDAIVYQFQAQAANTSIGVKASILKGRIYGRMKNYSQGISELERAIQRAKTIGERGKRGLAGALRFRALSAMSEIVLLVLKEGGNVDVDPEVLVEAGKNCYREKDYQGAVDCFSEAIKTSLKLPFAKRAIVNGEPSAWYFMGIAYARMNLNLEAQLAYEGALGTFLPQFMPKEFAEDKANKAILEEIKQVVLINCAKNGRAAAKNEKRRSRSKFNKKRFLMWIDWVVEIEPEQRKDRPYYFAVNVKDEADSAHKKSRELLFDGNKVEAARSRNEAIDLYTQVSEKFEKLGITSRFYEEGLYYSGVCQYSMMNVLDFKGVSETDKKRSAEYGAEALKKFSVYLTYVDKNPVRAFSSNTKARLIEKTAGKRRRTSHCNAIALYRPFILIDLGKHSEALKAALVLQKNEANLANNQVAGLHRILFKCFVALSIKDGAYDSDDKFVKSESLIGKAKSEAEWFKKQISTSADAAANRMNDSINKSFMSRISMQFSELAEKARKAKKLQLLKKYIAERNRIDSSLIDVTNIDAMVNMGKRFMEQSNYKKAAETFSLVLKKFDSDGNLEGKADSELSPFSVLSSSDVINNTPSVTSAAMWPRLRKSLRKIDKAMKGEPEIKKKGSIVKRAIPKDYVLAVDLLEQFMKDYPDYDNKNKKAGKGRKGIIGIRTEMEFRIKLLATAGFLVDSLVARGSQLRTAAAKETDAAMKANQLKEASTCFGDALKSARHAVSFWPNDASARFNVALCLMFGDDKKAWEESRDGFDDLRRGSREGSNEFWKAAKACIEIRIKMGDKKSLTQARQILSRLIITDLEGVSAGIPEYVAFRQTIVTGLGMKDSEFLGRKTTLKALDYRPKSDVEKLIDQKKKLVFPSYIKDGIASKEVVKFREELLDELLELYNSRNGFEAMKKCVDGPDNLVHKIATGRITSLKNIGGKSRGKKRDSFPPEMKKKKKPAGGGKETFIFGDLPMLVQVTVRGGC